MPNRDVRISILGARPEIARHLAARLTGIGYRVDSADSLCRDPPSADLLVLDQASETWSDWSALGGRDPDLLIVGEGAPPIAASSPIDLIGLQSTPRELQLAVECALLRRSRGDQAPEPDSALADSKARALARLVGELSRGLFAAPHESLDAVVQDAIARVGALSSGDRAYLFRYDGQRRRLRNTHEWCADGIEPQMARLQDVDANALPGWMAHMEQDDVVVIDDVDALGEDWATERALLQSQSIRSVVAVPLTGQAGLVGFLGLDAVQVTRRWAPEIQLALRLLGDVIVLTLTNREALRELRASESRWKFALEGAGQGAWDWDLRTDKVYFSPLWKRMLGLADADIGDSLEDWSQRIHPDDLHGVLQCLQAHLDGVTADYVSEHRMRKQDGDYLWILDRGLVVERDAAGAPLRMLGTHADITASRLAHQRLVESEAQMEAIFESSQVGIMLLTGYRILARANQRMADILGYASPQEMLGMSMLQLHLSEERFREFGARYYENLRTRRMLHIEYQLRHKNGSAVWCMLSGKALDSGAPPDLNRGVLWVVDDISHIKQTERALREQTDLFSGGPTMVFRWLPAEGWPVPFCSPNVAQILGHQPADLIAGRVRFADLLHPEDLPRVAEEVAAHIGAGLDAYEQEYRLLHADGAYRTFYDYTRVVRAEDGSVSSLYGYLLDVTRQRQAEAERLRLEREVQQSRRLQTLGQLAGGIAHEFNNLLAIIQGQAGLLQQRLAPVQDPRPRAYVENISKTCTRATDLVRQMLTFGRSLDRAPARLQLAPAVEQAIELARSSLPSSLEIRARLGMALPDVLLDPGELQQILLNLLGNARDAMAGRGLITVVADRFEEAGRTCAACHTRLEGDWVEISVADQGRGISSDHRERVFDPFFSTKPVGQGTGLGLAVVREIMERSGGHILIESRVGLGTRMRLIFPCLPEQEPAPAAATPASTPAPPPVLRGRVLVVDDEPILTMILEEVLGDSGMQVTAVNDSRQALELLTQQPARFDLLITDQTMPEVLGTELAEAAKAAHPSLPVIMCTGHSEQVDAQTAARFGVDRFLVKPAPADLVLASAAALLAQADARHLPRSCERP